MLKPYKNNNKICYMSSQTDKMDTETTLDIETFFTLLKKILINPIISELSVEDRIKKFTKDLGELLVFLWSFALKVKEKGIKVLREQP